MLVLYSIPYPEIYPLLITEVRHTGRSATTAVRIIIPVILPVNVPMFHINPDKLPDATKLVAYAGLPVRYVRPYQSISVIVTLVAVVGPLL